MRLRVYTPWWMKIKNWFRVKVFGLTTVCAVMVEEPGDPPSFTPKWTCNRCNPPCFREVGHAKD